MSTKRYLLNNEFSRRFALRGALRGERVPTLVVTAQLLQAAIDAEGSSHRGK